MYRYRVQKNLGKTSFLVEEVPSGRVFVQKEYSLNELGSQEAQRAIDDAARLQRVQHPNLIQYHEVYTRQNRSAQTLCVVYQPVASNGDLARELERRSTPVNAPDSWRFFSEAEVMLVLWQLLQPLESLHSKGIAHRSINPKRILLHDEGRVLLGPLGLKSSASKGTSRLSFDRFQLDVRSLGLITYELCWLQPCNETACKVLPPDPPGARFSSSMRALVSSLLDPDPSKLPTLSDVMKGEFAQSWLNRLHTELRLFERKSFAHLLGALITAAPSKAQPQESNDARPSSLQTKLAPSVPRRKNTFLSTMNSLDGLPGGASTESRAVLPDGADAGSDSTGEGPALLGAPASMEVPRGGGGSLTCAREPSVEAKLDEGTRGGRTRRRSSLLRRQRRAGLAESGSRIKRTGSSGSLRKASWGPAASGRRLARGSSGERLLVTSGPREEERKSRDGSHAGTAKSEKADPTTSGPARSSRPLNVTVSRKVVSHIVSRKRFVNGELVSESHEEISDKAGAPTAALPLKEDRTAEVPPGKSAGPQLADRERRFTPRVPSADPVLSSQSDTETSLEIVPREAPSPLPHSGAAGSQALPPTDDAAHRLARRQKEGAGSFSGSGGEIRGGGGLSGSSPRLPKPSVSPSPQGGIGRVTGDFSTTLSEIEALLVATLEAMGGSTSANLSPSLGQSSVPVCPHCGLSVENHPHAFPVTSLPSGTATHATTPAQSSPPPPSLYANPSQTSLFPLSEHKSVAGFGEPRHALPSRFRDAASLATSEAAKGSEDGLKTPSSSSSPKIQTLFPTPSGGSRHHFGSLARSSHEGRGEDGVRDVKLSGKATSPPPPTGKSYRPQATPPPQRRQPLTPSRQGSKPSTQSAVTTPPPCYRWGAPRPKDSGSPSSSSSSTTTTSSHPSSGKNSLMLTTNSVHSTTGIIEKLGSSPLSRSSLVPHGTASILSRSCTALSRASSWNDQPSQRSQQPSTNSTSSASPVPLSAPLKSPGVALARSNTMNIAPGSIVTTPEKGTSWEVSRGSGGEKKNSVVPGSLSQTVALANPTRSSRPFATVASIPSRQSFDVGLSRRQHQQQALTEEPGGNRGGGGGGTGSSGRLSAMKTPVRRAPSPRGMNTNRRPTTTVAQRAISPAPPSPRRTLQRPQIPLGQSNRRTPAPPLATPKALSPGAGGGGSAPPSGVASNSPYFAIGSGRGSSSRPSVPAPPLGPSSSSRLRASGGGPFSGGGTPSFPRSGGGGAGASGTPPARLGAVDSINPAPLLSRAPSHGELAARLGPQQHRDRPSTTSSAAADVPSPPRRLPAALLMGHRQTLPAVSGVAAALGKGGAWPSTTAAAALSSSSDEGDLMPSRTMSDAVKPGGGRASTPQFERGGAPITVNGSPPNIGAKGIVGLSEERPRSVSAAAPHPHSQTSIAEGGARGSKTRSNAAPASTSKWSSLTVSELTSSDNENEGAAHLRRGPPPPSTGNRGVRGPQPSSGAAQAPPLTAPNPLHHPTVTRTSILQGGASGQATRASARSNLKGSGGGPAADKVVTRKAITGSGDASAYMLQERDRKARKGGTSEEDGRSLSQRDPITDYSGSPLMGGKARLRGAGASSGGLMNGGGEDLSMHKRRAQTMLFESSSGYTMADYQPPAQQQAVPSVKDLRSLYQSLLQTKLANLKQKAVASLGGREDLFHEVYSILTTVDHVDLPIKAALKSLGISGEQIRHVQEYLTTERGLPYSAAAKGDESNSSARFGGDFMEDDPSLTPPTKARERDVESAKASY